MLRVGSRAQVMHGNAKMTGGGLRKNDLTYNKAGKIVSKKMSKMAKKEMRLQKAGYITTKGVFGVKKMSGGGKEKYKTFLNLNDNYDKFKEILSKIDSAKLSNLTITPLSYSHSNNFSNDPNPNTMLFKGVDQTGNEYFIKIGLWYKPSSDSRNILTERVAYERLQEKYPDNTSNYARMIGAKQFKVDTQNYGIIVLEYKDLTGYKNPTESDKDIVNNALNFLEDAGIIHLDIVGNILINEEGTDFFLMDFELADILEPIPTENNKILHKNVYNVPDMADFIISKIKEGKVPPTPNRKRRTFTVSSPNIKFKTSNESPSENHSTTSRRLSNMFNSNNNSNSNPSPLKKLRPPSIPSTPEPQALLTPQLPFGTPEQQAPLTPEQQARLTPPPSSRTPSPVNSAGGGKKKKKKKKK